MLALEQLFLLSGARRQSLRYYAAAGGCRVRLVAAVLVLTFNVLNSRGPIGAIRLQDLR